MKITESAVVVLGVILLAGCGSTSEIKSTEAAATPAGAATASGEAAAAFAPDLSAYGAYSRVVVLDFEDGTDKSKVPADKQAEYTEEMKIAVRNFADRIASEIRKTNSFEFVDREQSSENSLLISGVITRYAAGNAMLRLFIGFGAGSSYFDAVVDLSDNASGDKLGQVIVDRNSWGLGGAIAASQNVEGFMQGAAEKIAKDLAAARNPPATTK